jgi:hypothetical protein
MWPSNTVEEVLRLLASGLSTRAVAGETGVPRRTIWDWANGRLPDTRKRLDGDEPGGPCQAEHDFDGLPNDAYAYLLGMYLGDGYISACPRYVYQLRITCDARYPNIIAACAKTMESVLPGQRAARYVRPRSACVDVSMFSKHWPCLIPQHGVGRKHTRKIVLAPWQDDIVRSQRQAFLRGLIHSDGSRYVARQRCGSMTYEWPRYCFSNRSEDIKQLFCDTCDALGVAWRRAEPKHVYINRRGAVAILDSFVGPKS